MLLKASINIITIFTIFTLLHVRHTPRYALAVEFCFYIICFIRIIAKLRDVHIDLDHVGLNKTIYFQWDLVCGKNFYPMLSNTLTFVGVLVGSVGTGHMSDQYGRRPVLLLFTCVSCLLTCGSVLSPNIYVYMVFRFVAGMCLSVRT